MTAWVLFVLIFMKEGPPQSDYRIYATEASCQAERIIVTPKIIATGVTVGSINCIEIKLGELS